LPASAKPRSADYNRTKYDVRFSNAHVLLGLLSNIRVVDQLLGGLRQNSVVLMTGSRIRLRAAESYCLRAQLPEDHGGFDGPSLFIDGGNSFDVYLFASIARAHGLDYREALDKLVLSRAFTPYELRQLICKDSREIFRTRLPRLLVISDIFSLFEHDIEADEAIRITNKIAGSVIRTRELARIPIIMTAACVPKHLEKFVGYTCDTCAEFVEEEHRVVARLLKHPTKSPMKLVAETHASYNQLLLSSQRVIADG
jgi:hypothetical protein